MVISSFPRLCRLPRGSFFLLGVRGVGKSTWAAGRLPEAHRIDLLDERRHHEYLADAALFGSELAALAPGSWVIVDEVQRLPGLLNEVHRFIESRRLKFALLGSSARKLRVAGTNLLAGRAVRKHMHPLTVAEMGVAFDRKAALRFGTIPLVWGAEDRDAALDAYVQMYLREEIRAEALVRSLPGFVRFLPIAALFHGQTVSVSGIARDAGVARTTVDGYLEILEDTLLAHRLPAYEAKLRVRERKHPKLYWVDPGLVRAVKRQSGPVTAEEIGPLYEGFVLHLLRAHAEEHTLYDELTYWAPLKASRTEVDFLLRRGREFVAVEVKAGQRLISPMLQGLRAIAELPGLARRILVYSGDRSLCVEDGIDVWPLERLSEALAGGHLWP
ncbi:MAG: ATP-binding protein [Burkholderiales bacterium]|nr:ATP-binding protein [Burkholderiales bacterium]